MLMLPYNNLKKKARKSALESSPETLKALMKINGERAEIAVERLNGFNVKFENLSLEELEHLNYSFEDAVYFGTIYKIEREVMQSEEYKVKWRIC